MTGALFTNTERGINSMTAQGIALAIRCNPNMDEPIPPYDLTVIYAVGTDSRIHILDHGHIHDDISESIPIIESDCESSQRPGVYIGRFVDDGSRDWESGYWEPEWNVSEGDLLYTLGELK